MLAAAQTRDERALEALKMALEMFGRKLDPGTTLKKYVLDLAEQAEKLVQSPDSITPETSPEAVVLALRLATDAELRATFDKINEQANVDEVSAVAALMNLERLGEASSQFTNFGEAIRAPQ